MEYGTKYQSGNNPASRESKASPTAQQIGRLLRMDEKNKGRRGNAKGQSKISPDPYVANGFLKTAFLPKLEEMQAISDHRSNPDMEGDFFKSLSTVTDKYNIIVPDNMAQYPVNISMALNELRNQLRDNCNVDFREIRLMEDQDSVFFAERKRFDTGRTLYYIPIVQLSQMLDDPSCKASADLLLSVFSYLYHVADIPYHRQESSYLYSMYEMLSDMNLDQEEEGEAHAEFFSQYERVNEIGDQMERMLSDTIHLDRFGQRLADLANANGFPAECHKVAQGFFALYQQYGDTPIHRNFGAETDLEDDEDERIVELDKYVSFFESDEGMIGESLMNAVNTDLQELYNIDEPANYIPFDGRTIKDNDFDFEKRLFDLLEDLIFLLNSYKKNDSDEGLNK